MVSRFNRESGTVSVRGLLKDIAIEGAADMNRCIAGDTVCVELLPEGKWRSGNVGTGIIEDDEQE